MASPAKKRKTASQESKFSSSTPRKSNKTNQISSPVLSLIGSASPPSSIRSDYKENLDPNDCRDSLRKLLHLESDGETTLQNSTVLSASDSTTFTTGAEICEDDIESLDCDAFFNSFPKYKRAGATWKLYKPIREGRIYFDLINSPFDAEQAASELLEILYPKNPKEFLYQILRLCIDVCGYQKFNLKNNYDFPDVNIGDILKKMNSEKCEAEVMETRRYLMSESNKIHNIFIVKMAIYNFLQKLVLIAFEKSTLFRPEFLTFIKFVNEMALSKVRPIRHTGSIFSVKLLTAICTVNLKLINQQKLTFNHSRRDSSTLNERRKFVEYCISLLYFNFVRNCTLPDIKCVSLKTSCFNELKLWIAYLPNIFINQLDCMKYLLKGLSDECREVRLAALNTCRHILQNVELAEYLKDDNIKHLKSLSRSITHRFWDIDIKLSVKAIETFGVLVKLYSGNIKDVSKELIELIYNKDYRIAKAAADCILQISKMNSDSDEEILLLLASISKLQTYDNLKPLLVEACLDNTLSGLQNWKMILSIVIQNNIPHDKKLSVLELASESIKQILNGQSTKLRSFSRKGCVDVANNQVIAKYFFPIMKNLVSKYRDDSAILAELFKIVSMLDYNVLDQKFAEYYSDIVHCAEQVFEAYETDDLLENIAIFLQKITELTCEDNPATACVDVLLSRYTKSLPTITLCENSIITVKKAAVLFKRFNCVDFITWSQLFDVWDTEEEEIINGMLVCCHWYLIWFLRGLAKFCTNSDPLLAVNINKLKGYQKEFINSCFNNIRNTKKLSLQIKFYYALCTFLLDVSDELESLCKLERTFEELVPDLKKDSQFENFLLMFLEKNVISNEKIMLQERQKYFNEFVLLGLRNIISVQCLSSVLSYYDIHNFEYGMIIEKLMKTLDESPNKNILPLIVINSLTIVFEKIIKRHNVFEIRSHEAKQLMKLAKRFSDFRDLRTPRSFGLLLMFSVGHAFELKNEYYCFLYVARVFTDLIAKFPDTRKEVWNLLQSKIPKGDEKNDAVLYFAKHLSDSKKESAKKTGTSKGRKIQKENSPKGKKQSQSGEKKKSNKKSHSVAKPREKTAKKASNKTKNKIVESETESSEDLTIHDTSSDDITTAESSYALRI